MKIWVFESGGRVAAGATRAAAQRSMRDRLEQDRLDLRHYAHGPDERRWTLAEVERESFSHQVELAGS